jgi:hypothetical protein
MQNNSHPKSEKQRPFSHAPSICLYHLTEYPSGSKLSISLVNSKKGEELKDNGIITKIGATRKKNTIPQYVRNV